jgi:tRNA(Ile2) C34 agmatinyltransferase TiaS
MRIIIGLDDTDNLESRGTGQLARSLAADLEKDFQVLGVTRHQLLVDARIPYTSHNSSAAIELEVPPNSDLSVLSVRSSEFMMADFQPDSDPGLCLVNASNARSFVEFGRQAQREIVSQADARRLAEQSGAVLGGLGGSQDGVIGALAAVGLAASGDDGRYLLVGRSRELSGLMSIEAILRVGITEVRTLDGAAVSEGLVMVDKLRPARRNSQPVLFVEWIDDCWHPLKLG